MVPDAAKHKEEQAPNWKVRIKSVSTDQLTRVLVPQDTLLDGFLT